MEKARLSSDLPERFARLYDYETGKFDTPLDSQGIANIDALCELAIRTYPEELPSFEKDERNIHHVYWTEQSWKDLEASYPSPDSQTIHTFRNSTPQLAYVPLPLHAWIEKVMTPPPAPPLETMKRRNDAWSVAAMLLRGVVLLDKARVDYDTKKDSTRLVYGWFDGNTPISQRRELETEERINREYWLSELNKRIDGWKKISDVVEVVAPEDRLVQLGRLVNVRALSQRIKKGAMVPRIPENLLRAS